MHTWDFLGVFQWYWSIIKTRIQQQAIFNFFFNYYSSVTCTIGTSGVRPSGIHCLSNCVNRLWATVSFGAHWRRSCSRDTRECYALTCCTVIADCCLYTPSFQTVTWGLYVSKISGVICTEHNWDALRDIVLYKFILILTYLTKLSTLSFSVHVYSSSVSYMLLTSQREHFESLTFTSYCSNAFRGEWIGNFKYCA